VFASQSKGAVSNAIYYSFADLCYLRLEKLVAVVSICLYTGISVCLLLLSSISTLASLSTSSPNSVRCIYHFIDL